MSGQSAVKHNLQHQQMIKGLIFDMDGTLVPNMPYHVMAYNVQAERRGYSLIEPVSSKYFGWRNADVIRAVVPKPYVDRFGADFLGDEREAIYREIYAGNVKLMPGLRTLLDEAIGKGVKFTIGSAGPRLDVEFILDQTGLKDTFAGYVCGDDVSRGKPDPEIFLKAIDMMGLRADECVVFEDALPGTIAGKRAGCKVVSLAINVPERDLREAGADYVAMDFNGIDMALLETL